MSLPDSLTLDALKRRVDKKLSGDDELLTEFLEAALEKAQAPAPLGSGRLLLPDPAKDEEDPVQRVFNVVGRRVLVPDAREITEVLVQDHDTSTVVASSEYTTVQQDGMVVLLSLPHEHWCGAFGYWGEGGRCQCRRRRHPRKVTVTGRFGFPAIPGDMAEAIYTWAARAYFERNAQYADQVPIAEGAGAVQTYFRTLPPAVKFAFERYAVPAAAGGLS